MAKKKQEAPAPARRWIKLYCAESIRGSISNEDIETRGVWIWLLLMAGDSREDGIICATKGVPYPHKRIATTIGIPLAKLDLALRKFKEQDRITEDGNGIHITKWKTYQAPYQMRPGFKEEAEEPEPPEELTPEKLEDQARLDARDLEELRDSLAKATLQEQRNYWQARIATGEKWKKAHPNQE